MPEKDVSEKWLIHDDPNLRVKGFKIGDVVQWGRSGPRYKIVTLLQMVKDPKRWYAYVGCVGKPEAHRNLGLDYLTHVDVVERLAEKAGE
jgi:hypothetical protein